MIERSKLSRRRFLKRGTAAAAAAVAGAAAGPMFLPSGVLAADGKPGANDKIIVGVIGPGHRARMLMDQLPDAARIVAISDCYIKRMEEAMTQLKKQWTTYQNYHEMLEKEHLDAVIVGTPDHGRALPCIYACQAGLDVYAEKPLTVTINEGQALVKVARKYNRVFQVGSQQRTMEMNRYACDLVRNGGIGKVTEVIARNYPSSIPIPSDMTEEPIPDGDDWNMWLGATPMVPFNSKLQFSWMRWRPFAGGEMTNWGAHGVDQIQSALGMDGTGPVELWPIADGPPGAVAMRYANGVTVNFISKDPKVPMGGAEFHGEKGKITIDRNNFKCDPAELAVNPPPPEVRDKWEGPNWIAAPHLANWLDCIKTRKTPNADVEIGHRSISVCHLVNITRQLNRKVQWDPKTETFGDDAEANTYISRPRRKGFELPTV